MLVLFGDSFISEPWQKCREDSDHPTWFKMLSDILEIEYKTYGEVGSSFEYSTLKFYQYLTSKDYDPEDLIVFVLTTSGRSPVIAKEFLPEWAYLASHKTFSEHLDEPKRQHIDSLTDSDEHYNKYKNFYRDWFSLKNDDLILAQRYMLLQTLHSLPNKTISISVGDVESPIASNFPAHANFSLLQISNDEIIDDDLWGIVRKRGSYDRRINHLQEKNHYVLRDAVYAGLTDNNFSNYNRKSFHKNLFSVRGDL
jgi:hypothetical protein